MNAALIVFLAIIILLALYLVSVVFSLDYLIQSSKKLNPPGTIISSALDEPASSRYFYEAWIFIHTNVPVNQENILFNRGTEFVVTLKGSTLNIFAPTVSSGATINNKGVFIPDSNDAGNNKIASIPNFTYQKWTQLVVNVDGAQVDLYVDGKFLQSVRSSSPIGSTPTHDINYGNYFVDGKIARFRRPAKSINPQGVWQSYQRGSGESDSVSDYHVNVAVTKNKQPKFEKRLF